METKRCSRCGEMKLAWLFSKCGASKDGLRYWCKDCEGTANKNWASKNKDKIYKYRKNHPDKVKAASQKFYQTHRDKILLYKASYYKKFPEKYKAHYLFNSMVKNGTVKPQPCEVCGAIKTQAHHDDYSKPFDVRWLCPSHHKQFHTKIQGGKNG